VRTRIVLTGDAPNFSVVSDFDGTPYSLRFAWNERAGRWFVDLGDEAEDVWFVRGWPLEPLVDDDELDARLAPLSEDDLWSLFVFGRFFRPGALIATCPVPLTTQEGLSAVDLIYHDQATWSELLAEQQGSTT
jgi:hypothetical protein